MTLEEAKKIAEAHVTELREKMHLDIGLDDGTQEEHPLGYVFSYNTKDYFRTGEIEYMLIGHGPLFVMRETGQLLQLPSNQSIDESLKDISTVP